LVVASSFQSVVERNQLHFWFVTEALRLCKRQPQYLAAAFLSRAREPDLTGTAPGRENNGKRAGGVVGYIMAALT